MVCANRVTKDCGKDVSGEAVSWRMKQFIISLGFGKRFFKVLSVSCASCVHQEAFHRTHGHSTPTRGIIFS